MIRRTKWPPGRWYIRRWTPYGCSVAVSGPEVRPGDYDARHPIRRRTEQPLLQTVNASPGGSDVMSDSHPTARRACANDNRYSIAGRCRTRWFIRYANCTPTADAAPVLRAGGVCSPTSCIGDVEQVCDWDDEQRYRRGEGGMERDHALRYCK